MTESIQGAWLRLSGQLVNQGWPPDVLDKLRQIFYGGASAGIFLAIAKMDDPPDDRMLPLLDEIDNFAEEIRLR